MVRAVWLLAVLVAVGCGIDWTVPKPRPDGGGGGAGGDPAGQGGRSATSPESASSSTTTGPDGCDLSGDCLGCLACAEKRGCSALYELCMASNECALTYKCASACEPQPSPDCVEQCTSQYPEGAKEFSELAGCLCASCPKDCASANGASCP